MFVAKPAQLDRPDTFYQVLYRDEGDKRLGKKVEQVMNDM
jgi:hypothetical protein